MACSCRARASTRARIANTVAHYSSYCDCCTRKQQSKLELEAIPHRDWRRLECFQMKKRPDYSPARRKETTLALARGGTALLPMSRPCPCATCASMQCYCLQVPSTINDPPCCTVLPGIATVVKALPESSVQRKPWLRSLCARFGLWSAKCRCWRRHFGRSTCRLTCQNAFGKLVDDDVDMEDVSRLSAVVMVRQGSDVSVSESSESDRTNLSSSSSSAVDLQPG
jgi:hypothetical protein